MKKENYRHGDVIIKPCKKIRGKKLKHLTLAEGEVTGHSHRIIDGVAALYSYDEKMYLQVQSEIATLSHEEHKALQLPRGDYEVLIQEDYKPEGWSYVAD